MSIRKRLILSNIAMIVIPIISFILIEILLGIFYYRVLDPIFNDHPPHSFYFFRFGIIVPIFALTNGLLSYFVSRSILRPVKNLTIAAKHISEGNLEVEVKPLNKDELGQLAVSFELMRRNLKESAEIQKKYEENRKELIANISHDLKTPITSIKGYIEGIKDGVANTPEKMERYIETIYLKTLDMDHLINELFLYSKLDLKRVPFHFEEVNIYDYLVDSIEELKFDLEPINVKISFISNVDCKECIILMDREQFKRVMTNIIQNSLKYMDKDEKLISINLIENQEKITIRFHDNGKGISKEALPFIFDRFYRADPSRNLTTGGTGLGLAIAKRIIEEHGGEIWAESEIGEYTNIFLSLNKKSIAKVTE
ncbi:cell wall metabolism sensor histidine kinase WalK [Bacillus sp. AFS017336]|uniref:sensor histidine kinase n=1 Tax=Bacillus sp. AFS017336 TaxID=2033489 RepID=UPI000BEF9BBF|nr:HAMP domain-containing sensor histidine kinase [Bacillus sp. AFS017336]PEL13093.1 two-component sensor histidine kinase [Bacillus sp. AFS017336]